MKRPRIKASLCAYTYKDENGKTMVQLIHHNIIPKPKIVEEIEAFRKEKRQKNF